VKVETKVSIAAWSPTVVAEYPSDIPFSVVTQSYTGDETETQFTKKQRVAYLVKRILVKINILRNTAKNKVNYH
jgi:hypothetical protein